MAIPEQVRKQMEVVEQHYKPGEGQPDAADATPVEQGAAPESVTPPAEPAAQGADKAEYEALKQRYRTLQGMYNAEVPKLQTQNRELAARVTQMEQLLATAAAPATQKQAAPVVTQADIDEYGESLDVMRRVYQEQNAALMDEIASMRSTIQQLQSNVVPEVQRVAQKQAESVEQQFWADLERQVPHWKTVNNDPAFHEWLLQTDPLTGVQRQVFLEDAQRSADAGRVANVFNIWMSQTKPAKPNGAASELQKQVAPGRSRATVPTQQSVGKEFTRAEVRAFYSDVAKGVYAGREDERAAVERDIFSAQAEGRIID